MAVRTRRTRGQAADEADKEDPDIKNVQTIGKVTEIGNVSPRPVSGVSLVCGLNGTGGGMPPGEFRKMLENQLLVDGVQNVKELLASPNYAVVLVSAVIPVGARIGDPLDIEVTLPAHSSTTSLRGGYLRECPLYEYDIKHYGPDIDKLTKGHMLASAQDGPLLVGFEDGNEEARDRKGRIWSRRYRTSTPRFVCTSRTSKRASRRPRPSPIESTSLSPMTPKSSTTCFRPGD